MAGLVSTSAAAGYTISGQDDPIFQSAEVQLALERAKNEGLTTALQTRPQDPVPTSLETQAPLPTDPLELLSAKEREEVEAIRLTQPDRYTQIYSNLTARLTEARMLRQAQPLMQSAGANYVQSFKYDKSIGEKPELYRAIVPIFDAMMAKVKDLSPLVNMQPAQRNEELELRWRSAKSDVLEKMASSAPPKPEPTLLSPHGPTGGVPGGSSTANTFKDDEWGGAMAAEYGLTPEQLAELDKIEA